MLEDVLDILESQVFDLADDLKSSSTAKDQKATGDWINSVEVRRNGTEISIWANDYTQWLVQGRAPGGRPPINPLVRWVEAKLGATGQEAKSIAYAVATKIEKEGTNYHPEGTDLVDGVLTEQRVSDILQKVGEEMSFFLGRNLERKFKEAFV